MGKDPELFIKPGIELVNTPGIVTSKSSSTPTPVVGVSQREHPSKKSRLLLFASYGEGRNSANSQCNPCNHELLSTACYFCNFLPQTKIKNQLNLLKGLWKRSQLSSVALVSPEC